MYHGMFLGIPLSIEPQFTSVSLNAAPASLKQAYCFIAHESELSYFWLRVGSSVGGTDANSKVTFELQADSSGSPSGTVIKSFEQVGGWTANTQKKIQPGWTDANMTVGNKYWLVCTNTSSVPATDYISIGRAVSTPTPFITDLWATSLQFGYRNWNGTNWTTVSPHAGTAITIKYPSSDLQGLRHVNRVTYDGTFVMTASRAVGMEFRIPDHMPVLNVEGISLLIPGGIGNMKLYLYVNRALAASTRFDCWPDVATAHLIFGPLKAQVKGGDRVAIMTAAKTGSDVYPVGEKVTDDADFLGMKPFGGTAKGIKLESGVWIEYPLYVPYGGLYISNSQPTAPALINRRTSTGR